MKKSFIIFASLFISLANLNAQDNVAEVAHAFIKAIKSNSLEPIQSRFLEVDAAYAILPKESTGMNVRQKNETYIKPMYLLFAENFENIQNQITAANIDAKQIDLVSYKLEKNSSVEQVQPQAMSLFFNYKKKEHIIPISVVQIDERWYILEILETADLFKL